ncbi:MAG: DUF86 domain-containing protein [Candidatus Cloacimonetes bacterium]|nr:DUF86 domain-containing protein [Candidatus Cloacimonadota bacterium]
MKKDKKIFIEDIISSMNKIEEYIEGISYQDFVKSDIVIDAVVRNLEIIGEAAKNIPESFRNEKNDIPWKNMIGLRNIVIHEYFGVDLSIIWKIITVNIPKTKKDILKLI